MFEIRTRTSNASGSGLQRRHAIAVRREKLRARDSQQLIEMATLLYGMLNKCIRI
jgi:hypothetical protein